MLLSGKLGSQMKKGAIWRALGCGALLPVQQDTILLLQKIEFLGILYTNVYIVIQGDINAFFSNTH
jgi:hypothetical protein